jgi:hypothetical protein
MLSRPLVILAPPPCPSSSLVPSALVPGRPLPHSRPRYFSCPSLPFPRLHRSSAKDVNARGGVRGSLRFASAAFIEVKSFDIGHEASGQAPPRRARMPCTRYLLDSTSVPSLPSFDLVLVVLAAPPVKTSLGDRHEGHSRRRVPSASWPVRTVLVLPCTCSRPPRGSTADASSLGVRLRGRSQRRPRSPRGSSAAAVLSACGGELALSDVPVPHEIPLPTAAP